MVSEAEKEGNTGYRSSWLWDTTIKEDDGDSARNMCNGRVVQLDKSNPMMERLAK